MLPKRNDIMVGSGCLPGCPSLTKLYLFPFHAWFPKKQRNQPGTCSNIRQVYEFFQYLKWAEAAFPHPTPLQKTAEACCRYQEVAFNRQQRVSHSRRMVQAFLPHILPHVSIKWSSPCRNQDMSHLTDGIMQEWQVQAFVQTGSSGNVHSATHVDPTSHLVWPYDGFTNKHVNEHSENWVE